MGLSVLAVAAPLVGAAQAALAPDSVITTGLVTTTDPRHATQAIGIVGRDQLTVAPASTVEDALQGQIAGVLVEQNNGGAPGGGMQVQIRGVASINSAAQPLYVIDGVIANNETVNSGLNAVTSAGPMPLAQDVEDNSPNRIADINPADIDRIEVLKGPAASAIYGSKGAAGAILVTTRRATTPRPQWQLTGRVGTYLPANTLPLRAFPTYESANAWWRNDGEQPADLPVTLYTGYHNFQSQLYGGGEASGEGDLSVRGIAGGTNYFGSVLAKYDNGVMQNTGYNKRAARINLTQTLSPSLSASASLYYQQSLAVRGVNGNDNIGISPYDVFATSASFLDLDKRNANGSWVINPFAPSNPFADAALIETPTSVNRFIGGGSFRWLAYRHGNQSLQVSVDGGLDVASQRDMNYAPPSLEIEEFSPLPGVVNINKAHTGYDNVSVNLVHHAVPLRDVDATSSIGLSQDDRETTNPDQVGVGLAPGVMSPDAGKIESQLAYRYRARSQALYAQEQVTTLASRLAVAAGVTAERSAVNGDFSATYLYPKFGASYELPKFLSVIDELKLRVAYGEAGTAPGYGFSFNNAQNFYGTLAGEERGVVIGPNPNSNIYYQLADTHLQPERSAELETGFDAMLLQSRAQFSATVYQKRVSNLVELTPAPIAPSFAGGAANGGTFTNQGIELSLAGWPLQRPSGLSWLAGLTFARNYSRVDALPDGPFAIAPQFGRFYGTYWAQVGRSVSEIVNVYQGAPDGTPQQVGDAQPTFVMTLSNTFSWHGFRLYGLVDWHRGGSVINVTNAYYDNGLFLLADSAASLRRLEALAEAEMPYVESASFLKVREITVSYDVPPRLLGLSRGILHGARLSASAHNVFAVFRYSGLDPEVSNFGNTPVTRGQDVTPYPPARSFFLSVDLNM